MKVSPVTGKGIFDPGNKGGFMDIFREFGSARNLGPGVPGRSILSAARAGHPVYPWQSSSLTGAAAKLMELV